MSEPEPPEDDDDDDGLEGLELNFGLFDLPEDVETGDAAIEAALERFANDGPKPPAPINRLPRAADKRARENSTPQQLVPAMLRELGLDNYDIIRVTEANATERFLGLFLPAVRDEYVETGCGTYDCILQFRYATASDSAAERFRANVSQMLTRLRKSRAADGPIEDFKFVFLRYEILPDKQHIACSFARMTIRVFNAWVTERRKAKYQDRTTMTMLKGYL